MAIVLATEKTRMIDLPLVTATAAFATNADTVRLPCRGALISCIYTSKNTANSSAAQYSWTFNSLVCTTTYAATATTIVYDGATASTRGNGGYYLQNAVTGEILYVITDADYASTGGSITVLRGCLGTTAAAMADSQVLDIMNSFVLNVNAAGIANVLYYELPDDPHAKVF